MNYLQYFAMMARQAGFSIAKGVALPILRNSTFRTGMYAMAYPTSCYAPWISDAGFRDAYRVARRNTLVDVWRCYDLWSLMGEVRAIPGAILEVGVWRGGTGALLATQAANFEMNETVYLCDTWTGVVKTGAVDTHYSDGQHRDASKEIVARLVRRMGLRNVELLAGIFPDVTAAQVKDTTFRFCHIDVDVYQSGKDVLDWVWPRLSSGGIVVFDDYGFPDCPGITKLVNEQRMLPDRTVIHNLNGHGIVIKR
jgi:O-methyltransferase